MWAAIRFEGAELAVLIVAHDLTFGAHRRCAVEVAAAHHTRIVIAIALFCGIAWASGLARTLRITETLKAITVGITPGF